MSVASAAFGFAHLSRMCQVPASNMIQLVRPATSALKDGSIDVVHSRAMIPVVCASFLHNPHG